MQTRGSWQEREWDQERRHSGGGGRRHGHPDAERPAAAVPGQQHHADELGDEQDGDRCPVAREAAGASARNAPQGDQDVRDGGEACRDDKGQDPDHWAQSLRPVPTGHLRAAELPEHADQGDAERETGAGSPVPGGRAGHPAVQLGPAQVDEEGREPGGRARHHQAERQVQGGQPSDLPFARPEPAALHLMANRVLDTTGLPDRHLGLVLERLLCQPPEDHHGGDRGEEPHDERAGPQ